MNKFSYTDMLAYLGISSAHPGGFMLTKSILDNEKIERNSQILDIGCGTGRTSAFLAKKYKCNVTAIDCHPTMITKAQKRFKRENLKVKLINGTAEKLPFKKETFDFIIAESVIAFTNLDLSLKEISNKLKHKGKFISIELVSEDVLTDNEKEEIKKLYGLKNILSATEWKKKLTNHDFSSVVVEEDNNETDQNIASEKHDPSEHLNPELFQIFESHAKLIQKYKGRLGYRIFKCTK
ncbi:hypothetical protein BKP35_02980 [Anaerobacillus arseniciselenatis]|uniref:Methyltransferase domain-containing protein n=1 Tax=Anaerobacillus arseniciselenatis TaxID=85682 RepID=A0A1S2LUG3_9BACI|nr:class I SAM-dependent methyltransferase [Anaerobacillus arseniciselenatis]OIJ15964.1 hypothetical protein BKP35_02980 [Anaerobacillus arseniciselenatis]